MIQALSLRLRTLIVTLEISWALFLNNSSSYAVSIRGAGEVPSFRLSKSIEGVSEVVFPPLLKVFAMGFSQCIQLLAAERDFNRVRLAGSI